MKELTLGEIVEFSQRIEQESFDYYKKAQTNLQEEALIKLTEELAQSELEHFNILRDLLEQSNLREEELKQKIQIEASTYEKCVNTKPMPANPSARDILEIALGREENTRNLYKQLKAFTNLTPQALDTFDRLADQEQGHVNIIMNKLNQV